MMFLEKILISEEIIKETISKAKNPFVLFTGGKDSLVTLHLVRSNSKRPISALFLDTSAHFKEIYFFVDKIRNLWKLNLIKERNEEALKSIKIAQDKEMCCLQLKRMALSNAIEKYDIDFLFTGIRREDGETKRHRDGISQRKDCIKVNPIFDFNEKDVWDYIKRHNLPYCSLYGKGYRTISCAVCTEPSQGLKERPEPAEDKKVLLNQLKNLGYA